MIKVIFLLSLAIGSFAYIIDPGPKVKATVGEVWPKPQYQTATENFFLIDPKNFDFTVIGYTCDILDAAVERYKKIISATVSSPIHRDIIENSGKVRILEHVTVNLTSPCERQPHIRMDEWYYVAGSGRIISHSIWGILRGLETFSQLIAPNKNGMLTISDVRIRDAPRFQHRGLLLDTSRHFMSMDTIYAVLDGMSYNKLNVFHWHIVDDHSFPYQSIRFPELSAKGAYGPNMVYSNADVANVIEYARLRGIRVVAEFDVPGHTRSWGVSHPEILTKCEKNYEGKLGPINPINEEAYNFLNQLFQEVVRVFPDQFVHVGGDEVGFECWSSNSELSDYILKHNITYTELQRLFMERITRIITHTSNVPIVWQEAMVENVNMPNGTVVQVWTGNWRKLLANFSSNGHKVLLSACWYLDHLATGGDWSKFYQCEPHDFDGSDEQKKLVFGGEACMWSEVVSDRNVLQRIFPRASAVAERLWSPKHVTDMENAGRRLEEHTCRLINRGIPAQPPNGAGFC